MDGWKDICLKDEYSIRRSSGLKSSLITFNSQDSFSFPLSWENLNQGTTVILTKHLPKDKYPAKGRTELESWFLLLRSNQFSPSKIILWFHIIKRNRHHHTYAGQTASQIASRDRCSLFSFFSPNAGGRKWQRRVRERGRGTEERRKNKGKKREDGCQFLRTFWMSYAAHMFCHLSIQQILKEPGSLLRYWVHSSEKDKHIPAFTELTF